MNIGFQGKDPSTDFRGTGQLGLLNLMYLAENKLDSAKEMLSLSQSKRYEFFFACAAINITFNLKNMVSDLLFGQHLSNARTLEGVLNNFNELFCEVFSKFVTYWKNHHLNTTFMNFNTVLVRLLIFLTGRSNFLRKNLGSGTT